MRKCFNCGEELPPETEHFVYEDEAYCTDCVQAKPYTAYIYELDGEFIGLSENDDVQHIEEYEDEYEVDEK